MATRCRQNGSTKPPGGPRRGGQDGDGEHLDGEDTGDELNPGEPGRDHRGRDDPDLDEQILDDLLNGAPLPLDAPARARGVADALASLSGPGEDGELAAEPAMRQAFSRVLRPGSRRGRGRSRLRGHLRLIAAMTTVAVVLGGGTAAAYAGALPGPVQDFAHKVIGAPPSETGRQLCAAYRRAAAGGSAGALADVKQKLIRAAGGAGRVASYCAAAGLPTATPQSPGSSRSPVPERGAGASAAPGAGTGSSAPSPGAGKTSHAGGNGHGNAGGNGNGNAGGNGNGNGSTGNGTGNGGGNGNGKGKGNAGGNGNTQGTGIAPGSSASPDAVRQGSS